MLDSLKKAWYIHYKHKHMKLLVYTDGGARGNPGNAWIGVYITDTKGVPIERRYKNLWEATNNEAEYTGALYWIRRAIELWAREVSLHMDSKLVISQLSWEWKIKEDRLKKIATEIQGILDTSGINIVYHWIPREKNKVADGLSNKAMDERHS